MQNAIADTFFFFIIVLLLLLLFSCSPSRCFRTGKEKHTHTHERNHNGNLKKKKKRQLFSCLEIQLSRFLASARPPSAFTQVHFSVFTHQLSTLYKRHTGWKNQKVVGKKKRRTERERWCADELKSRLASESARQKKKKKQNNNNKKRRGAH